MFDSVSAEGFMIMYTAADGQDSGGQGSRLYFFSLLGASTGRQTGRRC